jgi:hypothetical protein
MALDVGLDVLIGKMTDWRGMQVRNCGDGSRMMKKQ